MDAESGNLMEIMVSDGKTAVQATEFAFSDPSEKQECNHSTVSYFHE